MRGSAIIIQLLYSCIIVVCLSGCVAGYKKIIYDELPKDKQGFKIQEGILCPTATQVKYKKNGKTVAQIKLTEPVLVAQAEQEEEWGYFQFPSIGKADDGTLIVGWQMNSDSHKSYGKESKRKIIPMMSKDNGKTWIIRDKNYNELRGVNKTRLYDGQILAILTPASIDITTYKTFPQAVGQKGNISFYPMEELPSELQGVYIQKGGESIHAVLKEQDALRYAIDNLMPITWWGNIKELADGSFVAGVYPCYYLNKDGEVTPSQISFYKSSDGGFTWSIIGKVPFKKQTNLPNNSITNKNGNYEEPTFEILADGTYVCVIRTGMVSPMLESFSYNEGETWTEPKEISPNGVDPCLKLLKNGVLALVSGRPGIQIRFSLDGTGRDWTAPLDMMPFMKEDGSYEMNVSCGYPSIIEDSKNSFLIVYSDFNKKNDNGEKRKAILIRQVEVKIKR